MNVTGPEQMLVLLALMLTDGTNTGCTVMVTLFELVGDGEAQAADDVSTHDTISLLLRVVVAKVGLLVPTLMPFTFHWYAGEPPPLVAVAVNITCVPVHIVPADALMLIAGATAGVMVIVILLEVAVVVVAHAALVVSTQVTWSLLLSDALEKVALFVPAFTPFTFHW